MLRSKVLASFRALHRARKDVFKGDTAALEAARQRINQEFEKHKTETDPSKIEELVKVAEDTAVYVRQMVVQAQMNEAGRYELRIRKDSGVLVDNAKLKLKEPRRTRKNRTQDKR
ncbi:PREDICTED: complex III assembly factor LYRM7-like [Branchiostoma belcheri]|uniref:Complex III assembly factor LYRM7 n=1 Tax=Branchiostoma belcheri TaxID=7741 RepID=A0A6P4YLL6_BRABE|nr:PREDICTED: complex III assembly factor LYRM7-like [Branchiostoma belcheri]